MSRRLLVASHSLACLRPAVAARQHVRCLSHMMRRELSILEDMTLTAAHQEGQRLDIVVSEVFPNRFGSATGVKRAIRRNELRLNGAIPRTDTLVRLGDNLQVVVKIGSAPVKPHASEGKQGLDVVYEDDHFACVVKPQGIPTQGKGEGSVQGRVKYCLQPTQLPGSLFRPHQVHRLDAGTGGLVLIAKTRAAVAALGADLAAHNMQKRYLALVIGRLEGDGIVNYPLQGKTAVSIYSATQHCPSESFGWLTWVSLWPKTGRTHQLRKHMAYIGHPVLGDLQYKYHTRDYCQAVQVADAQQFVPRIEDLIREILPEQQAKMAAAAQAAAVQAAMVQGQRHATSQQEMELDQQQQQQQLMLGLHTQQQQQHEAVETPPGRDGVYHQQQLINSRTAGKHHSPQQVMSMQKTSPGDYQPAGIHLEATSANSYLDDCQRNCDHFESWSSESQAQSQQAATSKALSLAQKQIHVQQSSRLTDGCDRKAAAASNNGFPASADQKDDSAGDTLSDIADMQGGGSSDNRTNSLSKSGQRLRDGSMVPMCLWAVQLQLLHPISREPLDFTIDTPTELYQGICAAEAPQLL